MKKFFLLVVLLLIVTSLSAQRNQIIAYIDMEYILENVPEYLEAQNTLDSKVAKWRKKLDDQARHIEVLKTDLTNEKAILTKEIIEEKEEEISLKQEALRRLEETYFGPGGDMFLIRKQLVQPIQDQVYNAIQSIAKRKRYDFVFEKSSDLIMLYSNKKYDISDLVLSSIDRTRLQQKKKDQRKEKNKARQNKTAPKKEPTAKQKEALKKIEDANAKKIADREAKKKAIEEKRKALLKQREEKRRLLREKKEALRKKKEEEQKKKQEKKNNNN